MWEILHIAQCHCTEWCGGEKAKGQTLGDAYPHIDFWDVAKLEWLAWAVYNRVFIPGKGVRDVRIPGLGLHCGRFPHPPDLSGETVWDHCGPATIAGANAQKATELAKEQGLPCYKERRVCIASLEAHAASSEALL